MGTTTVYNRQRSAFWMRVNENDDGGYNFFIADAVMPVFQHHFSEVEEASPTGWKPAKNHTHNIWVPPNRADKIDVEKVRRWAEFAGNQCVWLSLSRHLQGRFSGTELECCVAGDFNFTTNDAGKIGARSTLGEAEYRLKYHLKELSTEEKQQHIEVMVRALRGILAVLPLRIGSIWLGTPPAISRIPSQTDSSRIAQAFAKHIAEQHDLTFIAPTLSVPKPKMKELSIDEKIDTWTAIYAQPNAVEIDLDSVRDKTIVVVDDLYQSGITMWAFAKYLKRLGARRVFGIVCVKSMKDSDNQ
jgi:phosphoribosylpyrophosphate synthetase